MLPLALYSTLTTDICFFLLMPGTQRLSGPVSGGLVRGKQCEDELNPLFSRLTLEMSGSVTCFLSSGGLKGKLWLEVSPEQARQRKSKGQAHIYAHASDQVGNSNLLTRKVH